MILILFSLHPFYFHPLVFRKVVCKCDKLKKMFLHKVSCGQHRSLHNPRPRVWDGKEKRRPSSSIFSLLYPESRETSGQWTVWTLTGDWRLADQEINWVFCCETSQTQTFASAFSQDQTFFHMFLCYWGQKLLYFGHSCCTFCNGAIVMISSSPLL